ncbi:MAG: hypothetical protein HYR86_15830 [Candidatus Rokubacteria bacterium]|nr:hypothetical protein [Candidatus Rokubacteria bacterium]
MTTAKEMELSPYTVTDAEKMEAVLENPLVLLTANTIGVMKDLPPLPDQVACGGQRLLAVAEGVEGEALAAPQVW